MKPSHYFGGYAIAFFVYGCIVTAVTLSLTYFEDLLDISGSDASLIYTMFYVGQISGSVISGRVMTVNSESNLIHRWMATNIHYYMAFFGVLSSMCLMLISFGWIKNYIIMLVIWCIIGLWAGGTKPMLAVLVFRIYIFDGTIIMTRLGLLHSIARALYAVIYDINYVNYLWYVIIIPTLIYSIMFFFYLPTPQEQEKEEQVVDDIVGEIIEKTDIQLEEQIS